MAYEEDYQAYREAIAAGISLLRPRAEVRTAAPGELNAKIALLEPQVVVCGVPGRLDSEDVLAWVVLPPGVGRPARVRVGDGRRETVGLTLEGLLRIVDEAEELVRAKATHARDQGHQGFINRTS